MRTLDDVLEQWKEDCQIPRNDLAETSRLTPMLHAKYLAVLSATKLRLKQAEMDQKRLLKLKWLHYNGKLPQEEIEKHGWEYDPLDGLKILKGDMNHFYDADPEIQQSELKIQYLKEMAETLKDIVDALKWRHQTIKNIIEWKKFEAGA